MQTLELEYKFPSLNEYTNANRGNKYLGASIKKNLTTIVKLECKRQKLKPTAGSVTINFKWVEINRKRDKDNIAAAKKFILDGLVEAGVIANDTWEYIEGFSDSFEIGKKHKVIVDII